MATHELIDLSNTTPLRLTPNGLHSGMDITMQNVNDTGYIYLGSDINISSTDYGFRILPNHSISFELPTPDSLYAIASLSGMKVAVIKTGLESGF